MRTKRSAAKSARDLPRYPLEQVKLINASLDRELSENLTLQGNVITRALILVGASALSTVPLTDAVQNKWYFASVLLAGIAALCGVASLWLWKSPSSEIEQKHVNVMLKSHPYSVEHRLMTDKLGILVPRRRDVKRKAKAVSIGFSFLVAAWASIVCVAGYQLVNK
jgi:hypothetical protein